MKTITEKLELQKMHNWIQHILKLKTQLIELTSMRQKELIQ